MKTDFIYSFCGSFYMLTPMTEKAYNWIQDNVQLSHWQNDDNIPIDIRCFNDIYAGITADQLSIENW